jgi:hypothetical protein
MENVFINFDDIGIILCDNCMIYDVSNMFYIDFQYF